MFIVKSCHNEFNPKKCGTLMIGTLETYRETEDKQIVDIYEGRYFLEYDLSNIYVTEKEYERLMSSDEHYWSLVVEHMSLGYSHPNDPEKKLLKNLRMKKLLTSKNSFIFCASQVKNHVNAAEIFKDYNDYWYFKNKKVDTILSKMAASLKEELCKQLKNGLDIFDKEVSYENLIVKPHFQEIVYENKIVKIDNKSYFFDPELPYDISNNLKFIKPKAFAKEQEIRFVFECYDGDTILYPEIKYAIIEAGPLLKHIISK